jgi:hypothetical protein
MVPARLNGRKQGIQDNIHNRQRAKTFAMTGISQNP